MGDKTEETFLIPNPATWGCSTGTRLTCMGFKEEFNQVYELGTSSVFWDPRVDEKSYSIMVSGKPVSFQTQHEMIKISVAFRFMLEQGRRESSSNNINV